MISIVIPCFREENRLPIFLKDLYEKIKICLDVEFIIVDDGSPDELYDQMYEKIQYYLNDQIKIYRYLQNKGKGNAITYGLENSKGNLLGFVDSDGAIPAYEVFRLIDYIKANPEIDLVAGSRVLMLGKKVERGLKRHISNRIFATYFSNLFNIYMYDPQCGIKIFKKSAYEKVKSKITDQGWLWDTQLIIQFFRHNYKIVEVPIDWNDKPGSKVSLFKDSLVMLFRLLNYRIAINK